jgi:hypothetical protein
VYEFGWIGDARWYCSREELTDELLSVVQGLSPCFGLAFWIVGEVVEGVVEGVGRLVVDGFDWNGWGCGMESWWRRKF